VIFTYHPSVPPIVILQCFYNLKDERYLSYIINKTLLVLPTYKKIRKWLIEKTTITQIIQEIDAFEIIVDASIIFLRNEIPKKKSTLKWIQFDKSGNKASEINIKQLDFLLNYHAELHYTKDKKILQHIESGSTRLSESYSASRGMNIGGCSEYFIKNEITDKYVHRYLAGHENVPERYKLVWPSRSRTKFILFDKNLEATLKMEKNATIALGKELKYNVPKIVVNEASQGIIATYDDNNYYASYSFHIINRMKDHSLKYLLSILNSKLMTYYAIKSEILRKGKKATPHLGTKGLSRLPIKFSIYPELFISIAEMLLAINSYTNDQNDTNNSIQYLDQDLLDSLVYELYFGDQIGSNLVEEIRRNFSEFQSISFDGNSKAIESIVTKLKNDPEIRNNIKKIKGQKWIKEIENFQQ